MDSPPTDNREQDDHGYRIAGITGLLEPYGDSWSGRWPYDGQGSAPCPEPYGGSCPCPASVPYGGYGFCYGAPVDPHNEHRHEDLP